MTTKPIAKKLVNAFFDTGNVTGRYPMPGPSTGPSAKAKRIRYGYGAEHYGLMLIDFLYQAGKAWELAENDPEENVMPMPTFAKRVYKRVAKFGEILGPFRPDYAHKAAYMGIFNAKDDGMNNAVEDFAHYLNLCLMNASNRDILAFVEAVAGDMKAEDLRQTKHYFYNWVTFLRGANYGNCYSMELEFSKDRVYFTYYISSDFYKEDAIFPYESKSWEDPSTWTKDVVSMKVLLENLKTPPATKPSDDEDPK